MFKMRLSLYKESALAHLQCQQIRTIDGLQLTNRITCLRTATLLKKRLWHRCFPVNFAKFLRIPFYRTPLGACFCICEICFHLVWAPRFISKMCWTDNPYFRYLAGLPLICRTTPSPPHGIFERLFAHSASPPKCKFEELLLMATKLYKIT